MNVSVVIPAYNRRSLLYYTIDSLSEKFHPGVNIEIIVVDDHSDDDTATYIPEHYPNIKFFINDRKGAQSARNLGLKHASHDYVMLLDSDDIVGPGYFLEKLRTFEQNANIDICYGEYERFSSKGGVTPESIQFAHKYPLICDTNSNSKHLENYLSGFFFPPHCLIWKKKFLMSIGAYDETVKINQDVELFIRAILNNAQILGIKDETKVYYRMHNNDHRMGDLNSAAKLTHILELRKKIFSEMQQKGFKDVAYRKKMSLYLFNQWRKFRFTFPEAAEQTLSFSKQVYWPVELNGNALVKLLSKILGPDNYIKLKYKLLKS